MILGASDRRALGSQQAVRNAQYLQERLVFSEGRILDHEQGAVMMQWEKALMESHAQVKMIMFFLFLISSGGYATGLL